MPFKYYSPDFYSYSGGLQVENHHLNQLGAVDSSAFTAEELGAIVEPAARQEQVMKELEKTYPEYGIGGAKIAFRVLNQDAPDTQPPILYSFSWALCAPNPVGGQILSCIAAANPNRRIISYDNPNYGESDNMPVSVRKTMASDGSFQPFGIHLVTALSGLLEGVKVVDWGGDSEGACKLLGTLAVSKDQLAARRVAIVDGPVARARSMFRFGIVDFTLREALNARKYISASTDIEAAELHKVAYNPKTVVAEMVRHIRGGSWHCNYFTETALMAHAAIQPDLIAALPNIRERLTWFSPHKSALNTPEETRAMLLGVLAGASAAPEVIQRVFKGTHCYGVANPSVPARFLADSFS